ncbi:MAG: hypothetical protein NTV74_06630 [Euryarchaeota archaeon]|nr:hypothetical protein [Euryarchaeota archaeon]
MSGKRFVTAINCIDGRVQIPVIDWMKKEFKADYVDMITEPGPNKLLTESRFSLESAFVKKKVEVSVQKHGSKIVAVVGHYDCAGNSVDMENHIRQTKSAVETVESWGFNASVIGLWVDEHWVVYKII